MGLKPTGEKEVLGRVLVIGGCGFLGHHIVQQLHSSYDCTVSILDLQTTRNRLLDTTGVRYFEGDITSIDSILPIFEETKPDIVIHTASPTLTGGSRQLYQRVNIDGTKCVIEACQKTRVTALVYTSSASIISDNATDLINADERWPIIPANAQTEFYSVTKAEAEAYVLAANRAVDHSLLLTCALRPAGIFGEGDVQLIPNMLDAYYTSKTGFQLGNNTNLFDFTYVGNVAEAHILAATALLATSRLSTIPLSHERVDGEAFMITNDEPVYFWDFARAVWKVAGNERGIEHVWVIGQTTGLFLATLLEWGMWALGRTPKLTRRQVKYSCMTRYYDCTKAKRLLGYQPSTSLEKGIEKSVKWFEEKRASENPITK
ncbi:C-3 sterol dehydrogenase/C-4 decarboxylase/Erg26 [Blumeria hordei DH14]|uniref:Sterol-4-alpha-carboxylate 3-dehydrogenase ERG26, decarboxylating n=1 Tax=Blumeria graminis f. sp. hordei (strain DH14) TaxID=546991 RepID=N1JDS8_BLUG1|nr:C-3 sterol dehydrogenase/C-4 decarboxylase/Erg26 [Blumeria hordei DH14]